MKTSLRTAVALRLRTKVAILAVVYTTLTSCSQTSPYLAHCNQPACEMVAIHTNNSYQVAEGIKVLASPAIEFSINGNIKSISEQGDMFSVHFKNNKSISSAPFTLENIGVEGKDIDIGEFIKDAYFNKFSTLKKQGLRDEVLHSIVGLKTIRIESGKVSYFNREPLTIFYYAIRPSSVFPEERYQIIVADEREMEQATIIDLYKFNSSELENFLSSIKSYDY